MLPKSSKDYIKPTADQLGIKEELVDDVVSFFYADVRRALIDMRGPNVVVNNLGTFKAKYNELPKLIVKYQKHLKVLTPETFVQMQTKRNIQMKLEKVSRLRKKMFEEKQRKRQFYKDKKDEQAKNNMEK